MSQCKCHERDGSYVCDYCWVKGYRGDMQSGIVCPCGAAEGEPCTWDCYKRADERPCYEGLRDALRDVENSATKLSTILERFNLADIPYCEKDLNQSDIGSKIRIAKFILHVGDVLGTENFPYLTPPTESG